YNISFSSELSDRFGQQLGGSRSFSFEVGSFRPSVTLGAEALTTLDPMAPPRLEFFSTNYRSAQVHVHRVGPSDWSDYLLLFRRQHEWREALPELPGEEVFSGLMEIDPRRDELVRTSIDLAPWLDDDAGHFVVMVGPGKLLDRVPEDRWGRNQITWVQATRIGLDAAADNNRLQVWATSLVDGSPLADTRIRIGAMAESWVTDDDGLVSIELPVQADVAGSANWVEATIAADTALLPESRHWVSRTSWHQREEPDDVLWHVFDDRQMYRPGETVHLKGWLRRLEKRPDGGLGLFDGMTEIRYSVSDSRGNELLSGATDLAGLGGFDFSFQLPDTPNLGDASVRLSILPGPGQTTYTHSFAIQEFRTPEFEVTTRSAPGPFVGPEPIDIEVEAAYFAGGALPGADVRWNVSAEQGHYDPPNRDEWSFGFQTPWWMPWHWRERNGSATQQLEGRTDGDGKHAVAIGLDFSEQPRPLRITAAATVTDVNRQAWSSSSEILAHPGDVYVGLKSETYFVDRHQPLVIDLLTVDIDGEPAGNRPVVVEAKRILHFWRDGGGGGRSADDVQRCDLSTADDGLGRCSFETDIGGQYQITATTMDEAGRRNATRIVRWVGGGRMARAERVEIEEILLVPDRDSHAPGDVARLLVQAPFDDAEGLLTLRRHGLAEQRRFTIEGGSATLEIQLRRDWLPNIQAHVTLVGTSTRGDDENSRTLPPRPAIAVGTHDFAISTAQRALEVRINPASVGLTPGESTDIDLEVLDAAGDPVAGAEIALVVVDEAILALTDYRITDPLDVFYQSRPPGVRDHHLRPSIRLLSAADLVEELAQDKLVMEVGMDRAQVTGVRMAQPAPAPPGMEADPIDVREDFNPLAAFIPALVTGEDGRVSTRVSLPDNLTRYRISALAVSGPNLYGKSEATLTARLPLMLRPAPPRFLNFGDVFDFPVVLQNQTDSTVQVQVAMEAANLELTGSRGYSLEVPANDRVEVRFPAAARSAGTARYQMAVATEDFADAARGQLPVWTPATTEAFATYGAVDHGAMVQPVVAPTDVWPQFGQLEVTTTSTAVHSLTDAFIYLHDYPFAGSEQIASRMIAVAALRDVLEAFDVADMPSPEEITVSMERDLQRLAGLQNPDGGFGLWRRGHGSWPYSSLHVAHALVRARQKGYEVEAGLFDRTLNHVAHIEQHIPPAYNDWVRRHIVAYS
ncbi:MAG: alpha-2-macroglobulin family protein, partial [Wenzhouxiangella sp.]